MIVNDKFDSSDWQIEVPDPSRRQVKGLELQEKRFSLFVRDMRDRIPRKLALKEPK